MTACYHPFALVGMSAESCRVALPPRYQPGRYGLVLATLPSLSVLVLPALPVWGTGSGGQSVAPPSSGLSAGRSLPWSYRVSRLRRSGADVITGSVGRCYDVSAFHLDRVGRLAGLLRGARYLWAPFFALAGKGRGAGSVSTSGFQNRPHPS